MNNVDPLAEACAALGIASGDVIASRVYPDRVVVVVRQGGKYTYTVTQPAVIAASSQNEVVGEPLPFDEAPDPTAQPGPDDGFPPESRGNDAADAPQSILPQEVVKKRGKKAK